MDRGAWWATIHEDHKIVRHDLVTKRQQQPILYRVPIYSFCLINVYTQFHHHDPKVFII